VTSRADRVGHFSHSEIRPLGTNCRDIDIFDFAPTSEEVRAISALDTASEADQTRSK
jgi:hypothetical protein